MAIVTRIHLAQAVREKAGLTRRAARSLVASLIGEAAARLAAGEEVELYGFGSSLLPDMAEPPGRNLLTLETAPAVAHRVMVFRAFLVLKNRIASVWQSQGLSGLARGQSV